MRVPIQSIIGNDKHLGVIFHAKGTLSSNAENMAKAGGRIA